MSRPKHSFNGLLLDDPKRAVVFSLADGIVWASCASQSAPVRLGNYDTVTYMMRDFLAQCDLGERMALRKRANKWRERSQT